MTRSNDKLVVMMEIAILAALSMGIDWIDSAFKIGPYSFSFSMVPILILAIRRGVGAGVLGGLIWAILQIVTGDAAGNYIHPVQFILEYPLAFGILGVAGLASKHKNLLSIVAFSFLAILLRYTMHFFAGWIFWGIYAPEGQPAWLYSLIANGTTFLINTTVCIAIVIILYSVAKRLFVPEER